MKSIGLRVLTVARVAIPMAISISLAKAAESKDVNLTLEAKLASVNSTLAELDSKANNCISSFNMNLGEAAALLCDEFMRAIDGELLASYIEHCRILKSWRDEFVENSRSDSPGSSADTQANLDLMVEIEYSCGENALQQRTEYVATAFNTLQKATLLNQSIQQPLNTRLNELEMQARLRAQGEALQSAIQQQGQRQQQTTQQQIQRLENELIRQQIGNPR